VYDAEIWSDFGVAVAGAAAALTGLLFVAVSINLDRVLQYPRLPPRAGATLATLVVVLVVAILLVAPGQDSLALGIEITAISSLLAAAVLVVQLRAGRSPEEPLRWLLFPILILFVPALLLLAGGLSLILEAGGGLYWVLAGVATAFLACAMNAWVLLIEIHR
jgi:uncharacterized membrane protein